MDSHLRLPGRAGHAFIGTGSLKPAPSCGVGVCSVNIISQRIYINTII